MKVAQLHRPRMKKAHFRDTQPIAEAINRTSKKRIVLSSRSFQVSFSRPNENKTITRWVLVKQRFTITIFLTGGENIRCSLSFRKEWLA